MRRLAATATAALTLALAACGDSACQELGEKICRCQPGLSTDACTNLVEDQLNDKDPGDAYCQDRLDACNAPNDGDLCEWLLTVEGKRRCGLAPPPAP
jgi:hypothetical protein